MTTSSASSFLTRHLVVPGQLIAISAEGEGSSSVGFLRGHGTYVENHSGQLDDVAQLMGGSTTTKEQHEPYENGEIEDQELTSKVQGLRLVASVAGVVERVNKLISVIPTAPMPYVGHVGDLVIGRVLSVGSSRWKVDLGCGVHPGKLPLSGVNLPGGVQRIRTAQDALAMRFLFKEGDLLSAEVQSVQHGDGVLVLHTRSLRYGKLENGCVLSVPPALIVRMKQHFATLPEYVGVDVLLGKNGMVWIQRTVPKSWSDSIAKSAEEIEAPLAETLQKLRQKHAETPVENAMREKIARVRNAVEALALVYCAITKDNIMKVYDASIEYQVNVKDMLCPDVILTITSLTRMKR
jgi:exosome complex component RRP4